MVLKTRHYPTTRKHRLLETPIPPVKSLTATPTLSGRWWFPLGGPRRHALLRRLVPSARNDLAGTTWLANDLGKKPIGTSESVIHGATAAFHRRGPVPAIGVIDERTAGPRDRVPLAARAAAAAAAALVHQQSPPSSRALLLRPSTSYVASGSVSSSNSINYYLCMTSWCLAGARDWVLVIKDNAQPRDRFTTWLLGSRLGIYSWLCVSNLILERPFNW